MDIQDLQRENNLLRSSLRELLRIFKEAESDAESIAPDTALEGKLLAQWKRAKKRAQSLVGQP
ncbi:MAG TPA: hypothetical protein VM577_21200 [Anaerovoracaceae bacterium]|nr:hypothetical protein [Anaerovoracaceae bacterium]